MTKFEEQKFNIGQLNGISQKTIEEHMKLYSGYVKNSNLILEHIENLSSDSEKFAYELGELHRRFSFEFDGMRNHEIYFESLEGKATALTADSKLSADIGKVWGSFDRWLTRFKAITLTRGIGWAVLGYDQETKQLINFWIDEQHFGQLNGVKWILGLDMWEHSYLMDYIPSEKKKYVEAFFANLNWSVVEKNYIWTY